MEILLGFHDEEHFCRITGNFMRCASSVAGPKEAENNFCLTGREIPFGPQLLICSRRDADR